MTIERGFLKWNEVETMHVTCIRVLILFGVLEKQYNDDNGGNVSYNCEPDRSCKWSCAVVMTNRPEALLNLHTLSSV